MLLLLEIAHAGPRRTGRPRHVQWSLMADEHSISSLAKRLT